MVAYDAGGKSGIAPLRHPDAHVGVAPQLAALQVGPGAHDAHAAVLIVVDPEAASRKGAGGG